MTLALAEALRRIADAQLKVSSSFDSTLGQDVASEHEHAYATLLRALDDEPIEEKHTSVFGERMFKSKPRKKKE